MTFEKEFISGEELRKRWNCEDWQVLQAIRNRYIHPFHRALLKPYEITDFSTTETPVGTILFHKSGISPLETTFSDLLSALPKCLFRLKDVEKIEETHPQLSRTASIPGKTTKPRASQVHKIAVRKIAEKMWTVDQTLTIAEVINSDEATNAADGNIYNEKVLRGWVKDLAPNHKPGRRTKK